MLLSILICTLQSRAAMFAHLIQSLQAQIVGCGAEGRVEILYEFDNGAMILGDKRNKLMERAQGEYVCFIDDDDRVMMDYVSLILKALECKPDVVGIIGIITWDAQKPMFFRHSTEYKADKTRTMPQREQMYERVPNHLCPTRTEIARKFPFPRLNLYEDCTRAHAMVKANALQRGVMIEKPIYLYEYRHALSATQGLQAKK
jgi:glycosyltransferase involved in cell wall biosynthesis